MSWARRVLLSVFLVTAVALVVTVWSSHHSIRFASDSVARSEGEFLLEHVRSQLHLARGLPSVKRLQTILTGRRAAGLRYVALIDLERRVVAGSPLGPVLVPPPMPGHRITMVNLGERIRMFEYPPPPGGVPGKPPPWHGAKSAKLGKRPPPPKMPPKLGVHHPPPLVLAIEFEPVQAGAVRAEAMRTLLVGAGAALVLLLLTGFFYRALRQREADDARREQERRLAALGEMSAVLAHEIRNPLASLKGHAQLLAELLDMADSPKTRELDKVRRVVHEAERLEQISGDLLDFVRTGPLDRRAVPVAEIVRGAAEQLDQQRFQLDLEQAPKRWNLDPHRLRQVLVNLMQNALQSSPQESRVEVEVEERAEELSISVRDHGDGIAPDDRDRVFEPFYTTRTRGTGLGLAVSRRLVEMHGGSIVADTVPGGGARFVISIPRLPEQGTREDGKD